MEQVKSCGLTRLIIRDSLLTNITKVSYVFYQAKEEEKKKKEEEEKARKEQEELQKQVAAKERIPEEPPLEKDVLDGFVDSMLPGCLKLLDDIPDTVYR